MNRRPMQRYMCGDKKLTLHEASRYLKCSKKRITNGTEYGPVVINGIMVSKCRDNDRRLGEIGKQQHR